MTNIVSTLALQLVLSRHLATLSCCQATQLLSVATPRRRCTRLWYSSLVVSLGISLNSLCSILDIVHCWQERSLQSWETSRYRREYRGYETNSPSTGENTLILTGRLHTHTHTHIHTCPIGHSAFMLFKNTVLRTTLHKNNTRTSLMTFSKKQFSANNMFDV